MAKGRRNKGVTLNPAKFFKGIALLLFLFVSLFFASCVTQKACLQKYPIKETHDTLIVYRDTTVNISVVGTDTVYRWSTLYDTIYASSGTAHSVSYVTHDTLRVMVWQSDTVITLKLDSALQVIALKDSEIYTIQQKCDKSKTERVLTWVFYIVIAIAFIVLIRFITKIVK